MLTQRGKNNLYPETIKIWRLGDRVPEWLSDRAKVEGVDLGNADKMLKTTELSSGGFELYDASGKNVLVRVPKGGMVCFGNNRIFALSQAEFDLLYEETK